MAILEFPPVDRADEHGLLAVGGDLEPESLLLAYRSGIFPWPVEGYKPITWFAPPERALLFLDEVHVPRSLEKIRRKKLYTYELDRNFAEVIQGCSEARKIATWIRPDMARAYQALFDRGHAHSVETHLDGKLVGGLYGVSIGGMFAGESMFHREPNASKLALLHLIELLRDRGAKWIDCQMLTPTLEQFGAREVKREEYMELLAAAVNRPPIF